VMDFSCLPLSRGEWQVGEEGTNKPPSLFFFSNLILSDERYPFGNPSSSGTLRKSPGAGGRDLLF
jgi:hypothetical protein